MKSLANVAYSLAAGQLDGTCEAGARPSSSVFSCTTSKNSELDIDWSSNDFRFLPRDGQGDAA
jgi:hypothetical protein